MTTVVFLHLIECHLSWLTYLISCLPLSQCLSNTNLGYTQNSHSQHILSLMSAVSGSNMYEPLFPTPKGVIPNIIDDTVLYKSCCFYILRCQSDLASSAKCFYLRKYRNMQHVLLKYWQE